MIKIEPHIIVISFMLFLTSGSLFSQNNLSLVGSVETSSEKEYCTSKLIIDGNSDTGWVSDGGKDLKWVLVKLPGATEVVTVKLNMENYEGQPIASYAIQSFMNGFWRDLKKNIDNQENLVSIQFEKPVLTDRIRLVLNSEGVIKVNEFEIYGNGYIDENATPVRKIITNQSGFNLGKPKRFTAPEISDNTEFSIINTSTLKVEFQGMVKNHIGDFSEFNPLSSDEYIVAIDSYESFPFRIGPFWLERITYRNMVDFMVGVRHYTGTTNEIRSLSYAWRDGDFFNWSLQTLVAQYFSNPEAYKRMKKTISYVANESFASKYKGKWGGLEPYNENAPDIVKLIHWDADVKITQHLDHEMQKAELAHFLYAYPYLKEWLPQQNFDIAYKYVIENWQKPTVSNGSTQYNQSPEHNLLNLKTKMGTSKGELPPGYSVIPNLMLYEVAKNQGATDANKYFKAAYNQMEWLIANLDWEDPITTKGQRVSEHITMRAFAYFYEQYPNRAPIGLEKKVVDWVKVMLNRSNNMWDFRKYTDEGDWIPNGWNETGNILGFPASALAAKRVIENENLKRELDKLSWSHFDNAFGRNPTGRHFSYDATTEIEGVDLGWYSFHQGGVGLLEEVPFVFDGSPKTNHYPNHPEIGNLGWTEGWVQHNTAFNVSMAYLAYDDNEISLSVKDKSTIEVMLKAPLNFDESKIDKVNITVSSSSGDEVIVTLKEESAFSKYLIGTIPYKKGRIKLGETVLQIRKLDTVFATYGLGYFEKRGNIKIN